MHSKHTTDGFVIDARDYREADRILYIFTRDFGLVGAIATGIRLQKSKLRAHCMTLSLGSYAIIRGREMWRLADACVTVLPSAQYVIPARIAILLKRFLHGEEASPRLFDIVSTAITFLDKNSLGIEAMEMLETLTVARMLHALGYIGSIDGLDDLLNATDIDTSIFQELQSRRKMLNVHINRALRESQL